MVEYSDPNSNFYQSAIGREWNDGNGGMVTLTNQGIIRSRGWLIVGRYFDTGNNPSNVDVINQNLMESRVALDINANTFVNAPHNSPGDGRRQRAASSSAAPTGRIRAHSR